MHYTAIDWSIAKNDGALPSSNEIRKLSIITTVRRLYVISGFRHDVNDICTILGLYAA